MPLDVALIDAPPFYRPGDVVHATAAWRLDRVPAAMTARLIWTTAGKGTTDAVAAAEMNYDAADLNGDWPIELTIPPDAPPAYDGRLISVRWSLQVDTGRSGETASVDLLVSPTGRPIVPPRLTK